jgi:hypothetical protein
LSTLAKINSATPLVGYRQGNRITYQKTKQNKKSIIKSQPASGHQSSQRSTILGSSADISLPVNPFSYPCTCTYTVGLGRFFSGDAALRFSGDLRLRSGEVGFFPKNPRMSIATWPWRGHKTNEKKKKKKKRGKSLHEIFLSKVIVRFFFFFFFFFLVHWRWSFPTRTRARRSL